jgi:hypothetical protein
VIFAVILDINNSTIVTGTLTWSYLKFYTILEIENKLVAMNTSFTRYGVLFMGHVYNGSSSLSCPNSITDL